MYCSRDYKIQEKGIAIVNRSTQVPCPCTGTSTPAVSSKLPIVPQLQDQKEHRIKSSNQRPPPESVPYPECKKLNSQSAASSCNHSARRRRPIGHNFATLAKERHSNNFSIHTEIHRLLSSNTSISAGSQVFWSSDNVQTWCQHRRHKSKKIPQNAFLIQSLACNFTPASLYEFST